MSTAEQPDRPANAQLSNSISRFGTAQARAAAESTAALVNTAATSAQTARLITLPNQT
jgi:hypothetical protein